MAKRVGWLGLVAWLMWSVACGDDTADAGSGGTGGTAGSGGVGGTAGIGGVGGTAGSGGSSGSAGDAGSGGSSGSAGTSGTGGDAGPQPSMLPTISGTCPTITEGEVMFGDAKVRVWVGDDGMSLLGPLVIYWHGTCGQPSTGVASGIGAAGIARIKAQGGMVAAIESQHRSPNDFCGAFGIPSTTVCPGTVIGNGVWCREDFDIADQIVACAIAQVGIDTRRIHSAGMSAGGVTSAAYGFARSGYLASVSVYSGGGISTFLSPVQDPSNKYAAMIVHGGDTDVVGAANFPMISALYQNELTNNGQFSFICDHGMGHSIPDGMGNHTLQFFLDHPYGVTPEPYATALPQSFPSYCVLP